MPADKDWTHHHFEVNLVSGRSEVSEVELTYGDTKNVMNIDGRNLPCLFADGFCTTNHEDSFYSRFV